MVPDFGAAILIFPVKNHLIFLSARFVIYVKNKSRIYIYPGLSAEPVSGFFVFQQWNKIVLRK